MTRLDKALAALTKAMGSRPFVLIYDQTHDDAPQSLPTVYYRNGWLKTAGLLAYAQHRIHQGDAFPSPREEEPK